jgi:5-methylthioadenosine/S-adenosylhomocysteine deaminase
MESRLQVAGIVDRGKYRTGGFTIEIEDGFVSSVSSSSHRGNWHDCIAFPGLIQTHIHLGQTLFRGMAEGRTLLPWLEERIWPFEASHTEDTLAVSVISTLKELFSCGCTGFLDMGVPVHSGVTVDVLLRSGARGLTGNSLMDVGPDWIVHDVQWLREEASRVRRACSGRVGYAYVPRFALSCSDELWKWMAGLPRGAIRATHASESPDEIDYPAISKAGGNIRFLDSRGFLGPYTLLAHCIHLQEGELELLKRSGTTAVHCPWTNLRLGSGIADVPLIAGSGIGVTVASDGAPCNNRLDLAGDLRLAMGLSSIMSDPSSLNSEFWLRSVTDRAARALGWTDVGRISEGYSADVVLLRPSPEEWEELEMAEDPVRYLLELHWPERIAMTMIGGTRVYLEGEFPTMPALPMNLADARRTVAERAAELPGNPVRGDSNNGG